MDKILIVDDERNVHYSFRRVLGGEYEVLSAFSGAEALRQVTDESLRLVLMDVRMPGTDGLDTLQALKRLRPDLPVIMMTAFVSAETVIFTRPASKENSPSGWKQDGPSGRTFWLTTIV